jgi:very-short-patch-repair endonuclease
MRLNTEIFIEQMSVINPDIEILGEYINSDTHVKVKCKKCNHIWESRPYHLKEKKGCPKCALKDASKRYAKSMEKFKEEMKEVDPTIEINGEYVNSRIKVNCHCTVCGNDWKAAPLNLLKGRGCPNCTMSKGEKRIECWLKENNINYEYQYRFPDCKNIRELPFDFYIKDYNVCIEYDGQQHFFPVNFNRKNTDINEDIVKAFEDTQKRDKIKDDYCNNNGIKLLRIPYTNYNNIYDILNKYFLNK